MSIATAEYHVMPLISCRCVSLTARRAVWMGLLAATACQREGAEASSDSTALSASSADPTTSLVAADTTERAEPSWCKEVPRATNTKLRRVDVRSEWFEVYEADSGVYAITEPHQFQEVISYLIVGTHSALLFDSGLGMVPIRPIVERLTTLPVRVLNSHTHYDHVGGNAEFDDVLARDTAYTRNNERGFAHAELASEVAPTSFCAGAPSALDTASYRTRAWRATRRVADGDTLDLGGRVLELIAAPGHTPDATALLDRGRRLLFTGDTYYDAHVWLFVPETDLDAYERSIARLAALAPTLRTLLPAHNTASADPARLAEMQQAIRMVRSGAVKGRAEGGMGLTFHFQHFAILTSPAVLEGRARDMPTSGSGLTNFPPAQPTKP